MNDADIDNWLRALPPRVGVPASFSREVWTRIQTAPQRGPWWQAVWPVWTVRGPSRLALAGAAVVVMAVGAWLGRRQAPEREGVVVYVQAVSPFASVPETGGVR